MGKEVVWVREMPRKQRIQGLLLYHYTRKGKGYPQSDTVSEFKNVVFKLNINVKSK